MTVSCLFFFFFNDTATTEIYTLSLHDALPIGPTVLTCPTTSCFDGLPDTTDRVLVGRALAAFGDKFQSSTVAGGQRYWRVPVMEGEFLLQESFGVRRKAVGGGNFLILGEDAPSALAAAEAAVEAMDGMSAVILPCPGGIS